MEIEEEKWCIRERKGKENRRKKKRGVKRKKQK